MIGPVLVHYKKTFASYLSFASSLLGMRRELSNIQCFGIDGEIALSDAFQCIVPNGLHLICSIHVRRNVKNKLHEIGVPEKVRNVILYDIFGKKHGTHYEEGLVDVYNDQMYDSVFAHMTKKWSQFDTEGIKSVYSVV